MADRPILFSGPMVRAILDGRKTQTRRVLELPTKTYSGGPIYEHPKMGGWEPTVSGGGGCFTIAQDGSRIPAPEQAAIWHRTTGVCVALPYQVGDHLWAIQMRSIPFNDGKYAVGDDGNLYDVSQTTPVKRRVRLSHNGYEEITLRHRGKQRAFRLNRLVAEAFYGPCPENMECCRHLNGNRRDNTPWNIDWGTHKQNSADAAANGSFSGERASQAKLSSSDVSEIRASKEPQAVLASRYGVGQPTISKILNGKRWAECKKVPELNFPRTHVRLTLIVTDVRVERLQDISEEDSAAEGWPAPEDRATTGIQEIRDACPIGWFAHLWDGLNVKRGYGWAKNPWVVAVSFEAVKANIDNMPAQEAA